jgi:hypothetical protein
MINLKFLHMKRMLLLMLLLIVLSLTLFGQYRKSTRIKGGADIAQAYSPNGFYRFAAFSKGALFSKQRSGSSSMLFNYNLLDDKMQFINQGDTLDMMNPTLFDSVVIDNRVFYYKADLGFVELLATTSSMRLVKDVGLKIKSETVTAYDGASSTSAVSRVSATVVNNRVYNFSMNEDVVLKETIDWYWIDDRGSILKASKKNFLSLLPPSKKTWAESFIKDNKIDFDKESDLLKLVLALKTEG